MTIRLAEDDPRTLDATTIGAAWLAVAGLILADGVDSRDDGLPVREISHVTLRVEQPGQPGAAGSGAQPLSRNACRVSPKVAQATWCPLAIKGAA